MIPGICLISAGEILVAIAPDRKVCSSPERLAAWAGLWPDNHDSGSKRRFGKAVRGNKFLKLTPIECAWCESI